MPFVYWAVDSLQKTPLVGNGDCVTLIKEFAPGLKGKPTSMWRAGASVKSSPKLARGTAIATFVNGRYPNAGTGQHAAFFLKHAGAGMWIMDQWRGDDKKPEVSKRFVGPGLKNRPGVYNSLSNNANVFCVIEL